MVPTPERQVTDRFIPDRASQDASISHFLLTSNENATPSSLLRSPQEALKGTQSHGQLNINCGEPYTQALARTLFPMPQTTVLGLHHTNMPEATEEERYNKSLAVVYEENKARNFRSKSFRVIAQTPERILDAPELLDDFYLNLVDWSSSNILTVALGHTVYLWNAESGSITQLMNSSERENVISCVAWHADGVTIAIGSNDADIQIWNTEQKKLIRSIQCHSSRVGALSWNGNILASGSRDASVCLTDTREGRTFAVLATHTQEVCGLKWSPNGQQLASGGNDNIINIYEFRRYAMECVLIFTLRGHTAAIKALAWNPIQPNLLVSGGGTADKTLRFWNTATGQCINSIDAKSQVCGVLWSHSGTELVSSHGYSDNQLTIWKYPSLKKITDLSGHTSRVLHLAMSPDGQMVVSAAGDETIRFWRCFATDHGEGMPPTAVAGVPSPQKTPTRRGHNGDVFLRSPAAKNVGQSLEEEFLR